MKRNEIMQVFKDLSQSTGTYQRLYDRLLWLKEDGPEFYDEVMTTLEEAGFKDSVDLIMWFEG
jgi:hypothetical protein